MARPSPSRSNGTMRAYARSTEFERTAKSPLGESSIWALTCSPSPRPKKKSRQVRSCDPPKPVADQNSDTPGTADAGEPSAAISSSAARRLGRILASANTVTRSSSFEPSGNVQSAGNASVNQSRNAPRRVQLAHAAPFVGHE